MSAIVRSTIAPIEFTSAVPSSRGVDRRSVPLFIFFGGILRAGRGVLAPSKSATAHRRQVDQVDKKSKKLYHIG